jgi:bisphosphoglycerate-dependent phosphoglycerate mutase
MVPSIREAIKLIPQMSAIDILSLNVSRYKPVVYRPENNDVKNKMAVGIPIYV